MSKDSAALGEFSVQEAKAAFAPALADVDVASQEPCPADTPKSGGGLAMVRRTLYALRVCPHPVVLLEGGTEAQRQSLALWWAACLHCERCVAACAGIEPNSGPENGPCCSCPSCLRIGARAHSDILALDGRISNKDDEENPGPVRALTVGNARALKISLGDRASGIMRVVILSGLDVTRAAAANALLKVLEEPPPHTVFLLLAPQREHLLPTLVSRSWVVTLPWPTGQGLCADMRPWYEALQEFLRQGRGWWALTSGKGAVDQGKAEQVVLLCQRALAGAFLALSARKAGEVLADATHPLEGLVLVFASCSATQLAHAGRVLDDALDALAAHVNPARVLDGMVTQLYTCIHTASVPSPPAL